MRNKERESNLSEAEKKIARKNKFDALLHEELLKIIHYDTESGVFTWKTDRARGKIKAGSVAGAILHDKKKDKKYLSIMIDYKNYRASRLAWFYMTNRWPEMEIDHKNNNTLDNRWENLREATKTQNQINRRKYKDNGLPKGVRFHKGAYAPQININGKSIYLGRYKTVEEALEVRLKAVQEHYGEFANFN
jgi:HNH endonuclease